MNRICVLGSVNQDYVLSVTRHPAPGETLLGTELQLLSGGKGANQALLPARFGARVQLIACVGTDPAGDELIDSLQLANVDTAYVTRIAGVRSGLAFITLAVDGENSIIVMPGANAHCDATTVDAARDAITSCDVLVVQLEIPVSAVERAAALLAARPGTRVILNASPPRPLSPELLSRVDVLVVNEHEAAAICGQPTTTGLDGAAESVIALLALGPAGAVVTCGAAGAVCGQTRDGEAVVTHVAAPHVQPLDTTGAGDAFTGALAYELADGRSFLDAIRFAVAVGAASTRVAGAQGEVSRTTVDELLAATPPPRPIAAPRASPSRDADC